MALTQGTPAYTTAEIGDIHLSFTAMGGSNRKLLVSISGGQDSQADWNPGTPQLGGTNLTLVGSAQQNAGSAKVYFYERNNASSGTIDVYFSASVRAVLGYVEWSGADTAALSATAANGNGTAVAVTVTGTASGDSVFSEFSNPDSENPPHTIGGGQTAVWDVNTSAFSTNGLGSVKNGGASITMTETLVNPRDWAALGVGIKVAGGGGGGTWPGGTLKEYNGATWVRSKIKDYTGATWDSSKGLKRWDGSQWLLVNTTGR